MNEHTQTAGDPSPIVAPMPKPADGFEEMAADQQHRRAEQPAEGPDFEEETEEYGEQQRDPGEGLEDDEVV